MSKRSPKQRAEHGQATSRTLHRILQRRRRQCVAERVTGEAPSVYSRSGLSAGCEAARAMISDESATGRCLAYAFARWWKFSSSAIFGYAQSVFAEVHGRVVRANARRYMDRWYRRGFFVVLLGACSSQAPAGLDRTSAPPRPSVVTPVQTAVAIATQTAPVASIDSPPAASATAPPAPPDSSLSKPPFPPPAFVPPHQRSAAPADGVFTLVQDGAAAGTGALARTTVHPHPYRRDAVVVVLAVDLRKVDVVPMAGTEEPVSKTVPAEKRPGIVPVADQPSLIAVFNGGFLTKHGQWGMKVDGDEFVPAREEGCTLAFLDDGSLRIATHRALVPIASRLHSYRQTPPCLVESGSLDSRLAQEDTVRLWGAAIGGKREIRRTAIGLDATGRTLFFGIGEWLWARDIALAMKSAGAVDVAELDINWSYTRFLLYDRSTPPKVVSTLIEKVAYSKDGYISKPAPRDFFYLRRKAGP